MPGPSPTPTKLKILKGVRPARINKNEPKARSHSGTLPPGWGAWMSDGAKRFWRHYAPMLSRLGVMTEADLPALRVLAELWSRWITTTNVLNKKGLIYEAGKLDRVRPEVKLADQLETQMLRYLQHFGMTASSRGNITVAGTGEDEDEDLD